MNRIFAPMALLCLCILAAPGLGFASGSDVIGTFADYRYTPESGDVNGLELRIVPVSVGYQGILQVFDGEPLELALVNVAIDGSRISFSFESVSGYPLRFQGNFVAEGIRGTLNGDGWDKPEPYFLKRGTGSVIWDRLLPDASGMNVEPEIVLPGTYAEIGVSPDGGLRGMELYIVNTQKGPQAVLQRFDGAPGRPVLADLDTHGTRFTFSFADERDGRRWTFLGMASRERVVAELRVKGAKESTIHILPRQKAAFGGS